MNEFWVTPFGKIKMTSHPLFESPWRQSIQLPPSMEVHRSKYRAFKESLHLAVLSELVALNKQLEPETMHFEMVNRQNAEGEQWNY